MRAVYAKDGALCAVGGALVVGTDTKEPPCACGGEPPVECEPDTGVCCQNAGSCTPVLDVAPPVITGNVTATGVVIRQITRKSFAGGTQTQSANIPVAITTNGFGAVLLNPTGSGACRSYGGTFSRFQLSDNTLTELICPGPLAPVRNITYFLGGSARFDPTGQLPPPGPFGGVGSNLATYTINLRVYDDFHLTINARVFRSAGRPAQFPASAQAIATVITTYTGTGPASDLPVVATPLNPCGTRVRFSITKPLLVPPLDPESCPDAPNPIPSNYCTLCKSFGVDLEIDVELGDDFRACTNCEPEIPGCCPIGCFSNQPDALGWRPRLAGITPLGGPVWANVTGNASMVHVTEVVGIERTTHTLNGSGTLDALGSDNCRELVRDLPMSGVRKHEDLQTGVTTLTEIDGFARFVASNDGAGNATYSASIISGFVEFVSIRCTDNGTNGKTATLGPSANLAQSYTDTPPGFSVSLNTNMTFGPFVRCDPAITIGGDRLTYNPGGCSGCGDSNTGGATI